LLGLLESHCHEDNKSTAMLNSVELIAVPRPLSSMASISILAERQNNNNHIKYVNTNKQQNLWLI
jgi:hypothetical protein